MARARAEAPAAIAPDVVALLNEASALHDAGRATEAVARYRAAIARRPDLAAAHYNLGLALKDDGALDAAAEAFRAALRRAPALAEAHGNLGALLLGQRRPERAEASFRAALRLRPDSPDFLTNLALALRDQGRPDDARQPLHAALDRNPNHPVALRTLAQLLARAGDAQGALALLTRRLAAQPDSLEAHTDAGELLLRAHKPADALPLYRVAHRMAPQNRDVLRGLAACLEGTGRPEEALPLRQAVLAASPDDADALNETARPLFELGRLDEALAACRRAIALAPQAPGPHANIGNVLATLGDAAGASAAYEAALRLDPGNDNARAGLGMLDLQAGDFASGLPRYEARLALYPARGFPQPLWRGEPLDGRTLLLHAEQGLGDTIMFSRFALQAARLGRVVLLAQKPLGRLLRTLPDAVQVVTDEQALPPFDLHCPLLSTMLALGVSAETIPAPVPYLHADPQAVARWRDRLAGDQRPAVGLVWAGSVDYARDRKRSLPLAALAPVLAVPGIRFVSLQKGPGGAQATEDPRIADWTAELEDFADSAALVAALDVVICVDTAVAHLAGALGCPVWVLNRFDSDWRWFRDRTDSPWYPSLRLFRQQQPGDWSAPLAQVAAALAARPG